jgi:hypothetical protein
MPSYPPHPHPSCRSAFSEPDIYPHSFRSFIAVLAAHSTARSPGAGQAGHALLSLWLAPLLRDPRAADAADATDAGGTVARRLLARVSAAFIPWVEP